VLAHPGPAVAFLHGRWARRQPTVIELAVGNDALQEPETETRPPWELPRGFTFLRERLAFLVWANSWDARSGHPVWWDAELAVRAGASPGDGRTCDVVVDGTPAWCDGGPRGPVADVDGTPVARLDANGGDTGTAWGCCTGRRSAARRRQPGPVPVAVAG
jgi:hypothetical protein